MNPWLAVAALAAFGTFALHTVAGTWSLVPPLLQSRVPWVPRLTHYYCWHLVTQMLLVMACGLAYAAVFPGGADVGWVVTLLAWGSCLWSLGLNAAWRPKHWSDLPQWVLFLAIAGPATVGLIR